MSNMLKLISRNAIDENRWNELVQQSGASVYNQLYYLDALAENWCALVWGDYQGAMAVPFTVRLGIKGIFTPNFIRALDWMGEKPTDFKAVELLLKKEFKRSDFNTSEQLFSSCSERVYQAIETENEFQIGSQSKRGIKKFEKTGLTIEDFPIEDVLPLIVSELREKVKDLNSNDFQRFENLLLHYDKTHCYCRGIKSSSIHAAIILIEWNDETLYIKGGVDEFGKQHGLMHALMVDVIQTTLKKEKKFSFEGSFVSSVRQFNLGLGGKDKIYYNWKWDNSPWWFKLLQRLRK